MLRNILGKQAKIHKKKYHVETFNLKVIKIAHLKELVTKHECAPSIITLLMATTSTANLIRY